MKQINLPCFDIIVRTYPYTHDGTIQPGALDSPEFDGILSLILAHAVAGVDIETPEYIEGIETAAQSIANKI